MFTTQCGDSTTQSRCGLTVGGVQWPCGFEHAGSATHLTVATGSTSSINLTICSTGLAPGW